jgi:hypothetical protein
MRASAAGSGTMRSGESVAPLNLGGHPKPANGGHLKTGQ